MLMKMSAKATSYFNVTLKNYSFVLENVMYYVKHCQINIWTITIVCYLF